jgi:hypothetical protein
VLHHGEIREQGTHQELLAERGLYWKLYKLQYAVKPSTDYADSPKQNILRTPTLLT